MSKSLGNFFTVREVLRTLRHPEVLRYFILQSHYRGPIHYSLDQLEQADAALGRIYTALRDLSSAPAVNSDYTARFHAVMDDDLNTPEALALLQRMTREINSARDKGKHAKAAELGAELRALASVLGLLRVDPAEWFRRSMNLPTESGAGGAPRVVLTDVEVEQRVEARLDARRAKNFVESDRIRDELAAAGVIVEDKPGGKSTWRRA
jgi:cysteinyl-tRNA synthetase